MPVILASPGAAHGTTTTIRAWLLGTTAVLLGVGGGLAPQAAKAQGLAPNAAPRGGQVVAGAASIAQAGSRTQITQTTQRAAIDWQQFNVGRDHQVNFQQPNAGAWTLNRVIASDPSVIAGSITANGGVAIVNQSGVVFANGAQVNVGSLIASTANISNENFMSGRMAFTEPGRPGARVENHGNVTVADRGLAALVAPEVKNSGVIRARLGRVALAGADAFTLDLAGDGLVSIDVTKAVQQAPSGGTALVTNSGVIQAEGGSVLLTAHAASGLVESLVSNSGRIEAATLPAAGGTPERAGTVALRAQGGDVRMDGAVLAKGGSAARGGSVEIAASGRVTLAAGAQVNVSGGTGGGKAVVGAALSSARGRPERLARRTIVERGAEIRADATAGGNGGEVIVHAAERTIMDGNISARGGPGGGDGGQVEVSSQGRLAMDGRTDTAAPAGKAGSLLIDPFELDVAATGSGTAGSDPLVVTAASVGSNTGDVILEATSTIRVQAGITKPAGSLVLQTSGPGAAGVSFEAPVVVSNGVLDVSTTGRISVLQGVTLEGHSTRPTVNGVRLVAGGDITNNGTIRGFGGGGTGQGEILAVSLRAGGTLTSAGTIEGNAVSGSGGGVGLSGATVLLSPSTITAETLSVGASGGIALDGVAMTVGSAAVFSAGGNVTAGAPSSLSPRNTGSLPAVAFDVRRGASGIPGGLQPDRPGLAPEQQPTQVRLPGQELAGTFGQASAAAGGTVALNLNATSSPVFLLLDGGNATGTLTAGRLGVHGVGGSINLQGALGGRSDGTAAQLADITRPIAADTQANYLFNGCIIGLATCTLTPTQVALVPLFPINTVALVDIIRGDVSVRNSIANIFVPEPEIFRLRRNRGRLAEPDVLLPNTAEEDY